MQGRAGWRRAVIAVVSLVAASAHAPAAGAAPTRPNVLIVLADDQAWSTFSRALMPQTFDRLVDRGTLYRRAYVNTPLCCPSRAEILTGLEERHTNVIYNTSILRRPTIVDALHDAGYRTMLAGKYLNSWPCTPRPEFDRWVCAGSGWSPYRLTNPTLNVDGTWRRFYGYQPDVLAAETAKFISSTPAGRPFFALYAPTTPHLPADDHRYDSMRIPRFRPPSYGSVEAGKPAYMRHPPLSLDQQWAIDGIYTTMARAVRSLDDAVGYLLSSLGPRAANTLVVYLSDNGYLYGEHARWEKGVPYEESVKVPMIIRYPPSGTGARVSHALVENVDIAPTIARLAGISWTTDGRSLLPTLDGTTTTRSTLLVESCLGSLRWCPGTGSFEGQQNPPGYTGVVTRRYAYMRYGTGERELYDLWADPFERTNLTWKPGYREIRRNLAARLRALVAARPHGA